MPDYTTGKWCPVWLCDDHFGAWQSRPDKLLGIDRPEHADEYWQPSLAEHIRLSRIAMLFKESRSIDRLPPTRADYIPIHRRGWTQQQWANYAVMFETVSAREALAIYHQSRAR